MSQSGRTAAIAELRALFLYAERSTTVSVDQVAAVYRRYGLGGNELRIFARELYMHLVAVSTRGEPPDAELRASLERMRVLLGAGLVIVPPFITDALTQPSD